MTAADFTTNDSSWPVTETVQQFTARMTELDMTVFAVIDQREAALNAGQVPSDRRLGLPRFDSARLASER